MVLSKRLHEMQMELDVEDCVPARKKSESFAEFLTRNQPATKTSSSTTSMSNLCEQYGAMTLWAQPHPGRTKRLKLYLLIHLCPLARLRQDLLAQRYVDAWWPISKPLRPPNRKLSAQKARNMAPTPQEPAQGGGYCTKQN
jgi:hypothetical protein